jgi:hypothetical protein
MTNLIRENIESALKIYDEDTIWKENDKLLYETFNKVNKEKTINKVALINSLYNTHLPSKNIIALSNGIDRLSLNLEKGDTIENVKKIATDITDRKEWVFASKYCHFHYPDKYPIVDSNAKKALKKICGESKNYEKENYKEFKDDVDKIIDFLDRKYRMKYSYKKIDIYLYLYSIRLKFNQNPADNKYKGIPDEISHTIKNNFKLFEKLGPTSSKNFSSKAKQ